ncbi:energy-coupling factor transporter transmembrane component T family protein [Bacillus solitudinis]|uniref:energy-coupling factor transporter transmembrane component T family protein n=1 Tax=Bacillus solitudinis TaxID=2014074 RepID=UPI000C239216|nr:energy-coupling factor transporter transmembrane component T [Bacillus solitudinis]
MGAAFVEEIKRVNPRIKNTSWGALWEPRTKTITCILFTFGVVYLEQLYLLALLLVSLLIIARTMQFTFRFLISKLILLIPFLILMSIPILLSKGWPVHQDLLLFVLMIALKSTSSLLLMMIVVLSQPLQQFIKGLAALPIPSVIVSVLTLTLYYTMMFHRTLSQFYKALLSRAFRASSKPSSLKVYSSVMAGVILKSVEQSDKVYQAMAARGFSGKIPTSSPRPIMAMDWLKSISMLMFIGIFILVEKWWFA